MESTFGEAITMYARYKCEECREWHPIEGIPNSELVMAWKSFTLFPPEPFDAKTWDVIFAAEIKRRGGKVITIRLR